MHNSTVEKDWLSHRRTQNTRTDTPMGHRALIMRPDGEIRGEMLKTYL